MRLWGFIKKLCKYSCIGCAVLLFAVMGLVAWQYGEVAEYLPDMDVLRASLCPQTKTVRTMSERVKNDGDFEVPVVPLSGISPHLEYATLAALDRNFKTGPPFSLLRFFTLFFKTHPGPVYCGGAIADSLVRRILPHDIRPSQNRLSAQLFTRQRLERALTKDEILCIYLNTLYAGNGFYGVEAASQGYLGKNAADVTVGEATALAALFVSSSWGNPWAEGKPTEVHSQRQQAILRVMLDKGWITALEHDGALRESIDFGSFAKGSATQ